MPGNISNSWGTCKTQADCWKCMLNLHFKGKTTGIIYLSQLGSGFTCHVTHVHLAWRLMVMENHMKHWQWTHKQFFLLSLSTFWTSAKTTLSKALSCQHVHPFEELSQAFCNRSRRNIETSPPWFIASISGTLPFTANESWLLNDLTSYAFVFTALQRAHP